MCGGELVIKRVSARCPPLPISSSPPLLPFPPPLPSSPPIHQQVLCHDQLLPSGLPFSPPLPFYLPTKRCCVITSRLLSATTLVSIVATPT